jgi:uncharacterized protein YndB with AHSA1/START domain
VEIQHLPVAETALLIRRPVSAVFQAFVDPAVTTNFWFTKSSGMLEAGKQVRWTWEMYDHGVDVRVKEIEADRRIVFEWGAYQQPTIVEWLFEPRPNNTTLVKVTNSGFSGNGDEIVKQALESTGGFNLVLAGAKAFLEHNLKLNLIADRFPDNVQSS